MRYSMPPLPASLYRWLRQQAKQMAISEHVLICAGLLLVRDCLDNEQGAGVQARIDAITAMLKGDSHVL